EALGGRFAGVRAFGVAGVARSLSPDQMDQTLPAVFEAMKRLMGAGGFQYKVCSTFDSSPEVGSIGRALPIGLRVLGPPPRPPSRCLGPARPWGVLAFWAPCPPGPGAASPVWTPPRR